MLSLLALLRFSLKKFRVINCSARLIYKVPKSTHTTPLLFDLNWPLINSWIQYKIALTCFHVVSGTVPLNLSELLHLYSPFCSPCSASDTKIFSVPEVCRRTLGERSFHCIGPVIWNSLPFSDRHTISLFSFKSKQKTHLFSSAYLFVMFFFVSIKPITSMFVFLQCVYVCVCVVLCVHVHACGVCYCMEFVCMCFVCVCVMHMCVCFEM